MPSQVTGNYDIKSVGDIISYFLIPMQCHTLQFCIAKCCGAGIYAMLNVWMSKNIKEKEKVEQCHAHTQSEYKSFES